MFAATIGSIHKYFIQGKKCVELGREKKFYDGLKVDGSGLQIWLVGHHEFSLLAHSFARLFVSKEASCGAVQAAERYVCLCRASPFH